MARRTPADVPIDPSAEPARPAAGRKLASLVMVWRYTSRYPLQLAIALVALCVTSTTTLATSWSIKSVIDRGFTHGAGDIAHINQVFYDLLGLVVILAIATAIRFYFVSWLGEHTAADIRI
eukprot:gene37941-45677_t